MIVLEGDALVRAVGTSHYQDALLELSGRSGEEAIRAEKIAALVPEPDNEYDPNAIAVHIEGRLVGYLAREENVRWLDIANSAAIGAEAMIAGKEGTGALGVFLRLPTPTEARAQVGIRLGRSGTSR